MADNEQLEQKDMATELAEEFAKLAEKTDDKGTPETAGDDSNPTVEPETPENKVPGTPDDNESEKSDDKGNSGDEVGNGTEESEESAEEEPKLILGKFKSHEELEKAYVNLEKSYSQKSQKAADAAAMASPEEMDKAILIDIENAAIQKIEAVVSKISDPEHLKEATAALAMYKRTGNMEHIEKARGFLDKSVDRRLQVELYNTAAAIKQNYLSHRDEIELAPVAAALQELEEEDPEWLKDEVHQAIMVDAIKLNRKVDVKSVKAMIDKIGDAAVKKYIATEAKKAAIAAEKKPGISMKAADRPTPPTPKKRL